MWLRARIDPRPSTSRGRPPGYRPQDQRPDHPAEPARQAAGWPPSSCALTRPDEVFGTHRVPSMRPGQMSNRDSHSRCSRDGSSVLAAGGCATSRSSFDHLGWEATAGRSVTPEDGVIRVSAGVGGASADDLAPVVDVLGFEGVSGGHCCIERSQVILTAKPTTGRARPGPVALVAGAGTRGGPESAGRRQ